MRKEYNLKLNVTETEGIFAFFLAFFVALLLGFVLLFVPEGNIQVVLNYAVTQVAYLIVPLIFLQFIKKQDYLTTIYAKGKIKPLGLLLTLPIAIGSIMQNTIFVVCFNWLLELVGVTPSVSLPQIDTPLNIILALLAVVILPPLAEESLFRGVILNSYEHHGIMKATFLSALVFALSHFNPAQFVHQFILGALLAFLVLTTGSIWYSIVIHLLNNLISLFIGEVIPAYNALATFNTTNVLILIAMFVVGAIILILSTMAFNRLCAKDNLVIKGNPFKIFSKEKAPEYHENDGEKLSSQAIGFIAFLVVASLFVTIIEIVAKELT